jgi:hypothetical protein
MRRARLPPARPSPRSGNSRWPISARPAGCRRNCGPCITPGPAARATGSRRPPRSARRCRRRRTRRHQGAQSARRRRRRLCQAAARRRAPGRAVPGLRRPRDLAALRDPREWRELGLRGVSGRRRRHPPGREGRGLRFPRRDRAARRPRRAIDPAQAKQKLFEARERKRLAREKTAAKYREAERKRLSGRGRARADPRHAGARYLAGRGLQLPARCPGLRYLPSAPYWHGERSTRAAASRRV